MKQIQKPGRLRPSVRRLSRAIRIGVKEKALTYYTTTKNASLHKRWVGN